MRSALTALKMALLAPMPTASVKMAMNASAGRFMRDLTP
jgi:hypothetical protein